MFINVLPVNTALHTVAGCDDGMLCDKGAFMRNSSNYCMSKKILPNLKSNLINELNQDLLGIQ